MGLWRSFAGVLCVEITSAAPEDMLSTVNENAIVLLEVTHIDDITVKVCIHKCDMKKLQNLLNRRGEKVRIIQRKGIYWSVVSLRRRPVLVIGLLLYLTLILYLPTRVLFVAVEGNASVPTRQIIEAAETCGIHFGASRRSVRSEKMKNALLAKLPHLQWAGVNTNGCVATISVQERTVVDQNDDDGGVSSIYAKCDGIIQELTVHRGNALCKVGQAVREGQLLVSGYTDCGITVQATKAQAEVYAITQHRIVSVTPASCQNRTGSGSKRTQFRLQIGKKLINLYKDSGISDTGCVKIYKEYHLLLPGGFELPVSFISEEIVNYNSETAYAEQTEDYSWMEIQGQDYLQTQMLAGKILHASTTSEFKEEVYYQYSSYACSEMIGQIRSEEIIQGYEQRD